MYSDRVRGLNIHKNIRYEETLYRKLKLAEAIENGWVAILDRVTGTDLSEEMT